MLSNLRTYAVSRRQPLHVRIEPSAQSSPPNRHRTEHEQEDEAYFDEVSRLYRTSRACSSRMQPEFLDSCKKLQGHKVSAAEQAEYPRAATLRVAERNGCLLDR